MWALACGGSRDFHGLDGEVGLQISSTKRIDYPRCSMYGIVPNILAKNVVNVGKYSIHGASGYDTIAELTWFIPLITGFSPFCFKTNLKLGAPPCI